MKAGWTCWVYNNERFKGYTNLLIFDNLSCRFLDFQQSFPCKLWNQFQFLLTRVLLVNCLCPGGLGEAVLSAVGGEPGIMVTRLAVSGVPRSGKPQELLDIFGISAKHIVTAVRQTFAN